MPLRLEVAAIQAKPTYVGFKNPIVRVRKVYTKCISGLGLYRSEFYSPRTFTKSWHWQTPSSYKKSVRVGNCIQFEVNFDRPGYLLLLQKDTSGEVWCFCPSRFASQPYLNTGKTVLPQEGSPMPSFPIEGTPGQEHIVAIVTKKIPGFDWLPQGKDAPLQLEASHLNQLLEYIHQTEECQVLYTQYTITE